jgi:diaminopimelate decarboxylase
MTECTTQALRVNPNVAGDKTHEKTRTGSKETKFGVDIEKVPAFFDAYGRDPRIDLSGLHVHLGSPLYSADPYVRAVHKLLPLMGGRSRRMRGCSLHASSTRKRAAARSSSSSTPG